MKLYLRNLHMNLLIMIDSTLFLFFVHISMACQIVNLIIELSNGRNVNHPCIQDFLFFIVSSFVYQFQSLFISSDQIQFGLTLQFSYPVFGILSKFGLAIESSVNRNESLHISALLIVFEHISHATNPLLTDRLHK